MSEAADVSFLHPKSGKPVSLVLTGDNGSGKSSLVDALEFVLQGLIGTPDAQSHVRPSLPSFATDALPRVEVVLEDGSVFRRSIVQDEDTYRVSEARPHPDFSVSPIVLRRKDILRFQDAPESERVLVFWNYLRAPQRGAWEEPPDETLRRLQVERLAARQARDDARAALATGLGVGLEDVPLDPDEFRLFVKKHVYGGFSREEAQQQGIRLRVDARLEAHAGTFLSAGREQRRLKSALKAFELAPPQGAFPKHLLGAMNEFLAAVTPRLSHSFKTISTGRFIDGVELSFGEPGALVLQIRLRLKNGRVCRPAAVLSEANQDLLALLFFLAVAQESASRGQAKLLVLDDVLQSVDATVRVAFLDFVLEQLADWQLFITVHDRMWREQVRALLQRRGHEHTEKEIIRWTFEGGPVLRDTGTAVGVELQRAMDAGHAQRIAADAGHLLEQACHYLSSGLPISVKRKRGDMYTLADLWPGIVKVLRRTEARATVETIDRHLHLRNLLGAHYNEWALGVSLEEAMALGESVLDLVRLVYCVDCVEWLASTMPVGGAWSCRCGNRKLVQA